MPNNDVITFRQSDFLCTSFAAFETMLKTGQFCDCTIKVQNHSFSVHRMILAAGIPYFQSLFASSGVDIGVKEMAVEDLDPRALESLVHFAYTGKVNISIENAQSLLVTSQFLQMYQVRDACVEFLTERLSLYNVLETRIFACGLNNSGLIESSDLYIRKNFEEFSTSGDFLSLPHSSVKGIISKDDLNVASEELVFEAVMKWIKNSPTERLELLPDLLSEVRMLHLSNEYVIERVDSEEFIRNSFACRDLINEVKNHRLLPKNSKAISCLKIRPRDHYKHDVYALSLCTTCGLSVQQFDIVKEMWSPLTSNTRDFANEIVRSVAAVNGKIYVFYEETIRTFCLKTNEWETLKPRHKCIENAAIVSNGNMIYFFGSSANDFTKKVRCFDTQNNKWVEEGQMKTGRAYAAAASLGEFIYVTGGRIGNMFQSAVEKYNPSANECSDTVASMLTARYYHGCTNMKGKVYVCGGYGINGSHLETAEVYDPLADQWSFISSMKKAKDCSSNYFSSVSHYNKIYFLGASDSEVYDPKSDKWEFCCSVPGIFVGAVSVPFTSI